MSNVNELSREQYYKIQNATEDTRFLVDAASQLEQRIMANEDFLDEIEGEGGDVTTYENRARFRMQQYKIALDKINETKDALFHAFSGVKLV